MLRISHDYPQSVIITNSKMRMEIFVHKFFPCVQPKLREILFMMQYDDETSNLIHTCKFILECMQEDLDFYTRSGYNREVNQLQRNIDTVKRFIG